MDIDRCNSTVGDGGACGLLHSGASCNAYRPHTGITNRIGAIMRKLRAFVIRLRGLFRAKRSEDEFAAELESHVALHIDDGIRAGLTLHEARRQALIRLRS